MFPVSETTSNYSYSAQQNNCNLQFFMPPTLQSAWLDEMAFSAVSHNAVQYEGMCPDSLEFNISLITFTLLFSFASVDLRLHTSFPLDNMHVSY